MTTEELTINIEKALEEIRPFLNSDGGDITRISCSVNQMTLKAGVETTIKKFAPQIETVVNIA